MVLMLGSSSPLPLLIHFDNHSSSRLNPSVIDAYILSEQTAGRYSTGFNPADLEQLIGPFSYITSRFSSQTSLRQISNSTGLILPPRPLIQHTFNKLHHQHRRFPHGMGHVRQYRRPYSHPSSRLRRSNLRYFSSLPDSAGQSGPAKCPLYILERHRVCRPCSHVWPYFQCWRIWHSRRYASSNLRKSRLQFNS